MKVVKKKSARGYVYYSCDKYPECPFITWDKPLKTKCPTCDSSLFRHTDRDSKEVTDVCLREGCGYKELVKEGLPPEEAEKNRQRREARAGQGRRAGSGQGGEGRGGSGSRRSGRKREREEKPGKKTAKKTAAKKTAAKKTSETAKKAVKKTTDKKTAAKKTATAKRASAKKTAVEPVTEARAQPMQNKVTVIGARACGMRSGLAAC